MIARLNCLTAQTLLIDSGVRGIQVRRCAAGGLTKLYLLLTYQTYLIYYKDILQKIKKKINQI